MPAIIAVFNQKGGVAKTTTTVNLATCLAALDLSVTVVDLDSQGNSTTALGLQPPPDSGAYELMMAPESAAAVESPRVPRLTVFGATPALAGIDLELAGEASGQRRLRDGLRMAAAAADVVLIDCPPALGMLPINALTAADRVLMPVAPEPFAHDGLIKAWSNIRRVQSRLNPDLTGADILLVACRDDDRSRYWQEAIRAEFGPRVLPVAVPFDPTTQEADGNDMPVTLWAPGSPAARAYAALACRLRETTLSGTRQLEATTVSDPEALRARLEVLNGSIPPRSSPPSPAPPTAATWLPAPDEDARDAAAGPARLLSLAMLAGGFLAGIAVGFLAAQF